MVNTRLVFAFPVVLSVGVLLSAGSWVTSLRRSPLV
jgi:hypothetical protein